MLDKFLRTRDLKPNFQVFFMRNDASQDVEIQEVKQIDFSAIQERLDQGQTVFITSKASQKLRPPKGKTARPGSRMRLVRVISAIS